MNELDPTRAALLALDFQNYGVYPQGYWASHWGARLASHRLPRRGHHCQRARRRETPSCPDHQRRGGLAAREPGDEHDGLALRQRRHANLRMIIVCNEGYSSSLAAASLRQLGIGRATDLIGGFQAWKRFCAQA
jgi:rhodanese-related sulfurtransferase